MRKTLCQVNQFTLNYTEEEVIEAYENSWGYKFDIKKGNFDYVINKESDYWYVYKIIIL